MPTRHMVRHQTIVPAAATFTPASLPNLTAWYDANDAGSITASGGAVSQWNDKSGNGFHLTQATGSSQPATGSRTQNGLNVLDFTDKNRALSGSFTFATNAMSVYMVEQIDAADPGGGGRVLTWTAGGTDYDNANSCMPLDIGSVGGAYYNNNFAITGGPSGVTAANQYTAFRNSTTFSGRKDGSALTGSSGHTSSAFAPTTLFVGVTPIAFGFDGSMCEIIICSTAHGTTDRDNAEAYLKAKWGTP